MDEMHGHPKDEYANPDTPMDVLPLSALDSKEKPERKAVEPAEHKDKTERFVEDYPSRWFRAIWRRASGFGGWIKHNSGLHDWLMVAFTGVLTWVAIQQFAFNQASSKTSGEQISKIIDAAARIEDAADSFSGSAAHLNTGVEKAVKQLDTQAKATQSAARTAQDTLVASNRPWLDFNVVPTIGLYFDLDPAESLEIARTGQTDPRFGRDYLRADLSIKVNNLGHSPAINVEGTGILYFPFKGTSPNDLIAEVDRRLDELCSSYPLPASTSSQSMTVFPGGIGTSIDVSRTVPYKEMTREGTQTKSRGIFPYILACVAYQSTVEAPSVWHTTRVRYSLYEKSERGMNLVILMGRNVPKERLILEDELKSGK